MSHNTLDIEERRGKRGSVFKIVGYHDGKRYRTNALTPTGAKARTRTEALAALARFTAELDAGAKPEAQARRMTLSELADAHVAMGRRDWTTRSRAEGHIAKVVRSFGASTPVASIDDGAILKWISTFESTPTKATGEPPAPKTVREYLSTMKSLMKLAHRRGLTTRLIGAEIKLPKVDNRRNTEITIDQHTAMVAALSPDAALVITIAWHSGMRLGEIAALKWSWVRWEEGTVHLPASTTKEQTARVVIVEQAGLDALRAWPRRIGDDRVFTRSADNYCGEYCRAHMRVLPGVDIREHDYRHTVATRWARAGVDLDTIMESMGWSSYEMYQRYRAYGPDDRARARRVIDAVARAASSSAASSSASSAE